MTRRNVSALLAPKSRLALINEGFISSKALKKIGIIINGISIYVATNKKTEICKQNLVRTQTHKTHKLIDTPMNTENPNKGISFLIINSPTLVK